MFVFSSAGASSPRLALVAGGRRVREPDPVPRFASGGYEIEVRGALDLDAVAPAWCALAKRALVANPYCEHAVLAAAARHLPQGRFLHVLMVRRGETLVGVAPVVAPRIGAPLRRLAPWRVPLLPAATPLLDRGEAGPVLDALIAFARERGAAFILADVPSGSALADLARARGLRSAPGVEPAASTDAPVTRGFGVAAARTPAEVRDAVEVFLTLEADCAVARRALALVQDPGQANLVRTATRQAAREKACRVLIARRDDSPVAAAVLMRGALWLAAERPDAPGARAALLARARYEPEPERADWTTEAASSRRAAAGGSRLLAAARRLFAPLARAS